MDEIIRLLIANQNGFERRRGLLHVKPLIARRQEVIQKGCSLTMCGEDADAVEWAKSFITTHSLRSGTDVFSFDFTGCTFAKYVTAKGELLAAHVHTDPDFKNDCKDAWIDHVNSNNIIRFRMFRPDCDLLIGTIGMECWGLITREGNCYTLIVSHLADSAYRLERIRQPHRSAAIHAMCYRFTRSASLVINHKNSILCPDLPTP